MLAFSYAPLLEKSDHKIYSFAAGENHVWIGTSDARLIVYALEKARDDSFASNDFLFSAASSNSSTSSGQSLALRFERELKLGAQASRTGKGKGKVKQLEYVSTLGLLLSLCDGAIEVWNAVTLQPISAVPLAENAGVKIFALDASPKSERLAVLTKKTAWVFSFSAGRQWAAVSNFALPDEIVRAALSGNTLAVATHKAYALIDIRSGKLTELFAYSHTPVVTSASLDNSEFLFAQERLGLVVSSQGVASRSNYTFTSPPLEALTVPPYVLATHGQFLEVLEQFSAASLQNLPLPLKGLSSAGDVVPRLCPHAGSSSGGIVFVWSPSAVAVLRALPLKEQVGGMLASGEVKRGLELYMRSGRTDADFKVQMRRFHTQAAEVMFRRCDFNAAFGYYKTADTSPVTVLAYFPDLVAGTSVDVSSGGTKDVTQVVVRALYEDAKRPAAQRELVGKDAAKLVLEAKKQLLAYLEFAVVRHKKETQLLPVLERALTLLAAEISPDTFKRRLTELASSRALHTEELSRTLEQQQRWSALALLHEHLGDVANAVTLWQRLCTGELSDSSVVASQALSEVVRVLSGTSQWPLLMQSAAWLAQQTKGADHLRAVFMNNSRDEQESLSLPHAQIAELLKRLQSTVQSDPQSQNNSTLEQEYLEYLVDVLGVRERRFHVQLSALYLQQVLRMQQVTSDRVQGLVDARLGQEWTPQRVNSRDSRAALTQPQKPLLDNTGPEEDRYLNVRRQLLGFLRRSELYDPAPLVGHLERASLREELLLVLTRLGEHERALSLLLNEMRDLARAEHFCASWRPEYVRGQDDFSYDDHTKAALDYHSAPTGTNPYLQSLFKLYVESSTSKNPDPETLPPRAQELLAKHGPRLDAVAVLQQIPPSISLSALSTFLTQSTQRLVHRVQATQVTRHVESSTHMSRTMELLQRQQAHSLISADAVCAVTGSRLSEHGAFLRYPNGVVTSPLPSGKYSRHVCPVSGRDFFVEPVEDTK